MENKKETFRNDSTKKQLGFEYQKLIALEYCLNSKKGEYVYIECFGDVQANNTSVEVKHHEGSHNLTSNAIDVWKTLKNFVEEYDKIISNNRLILHTTSNILEDSIFYDWNNQNKSMKYDLLYNHDISSSSKPFKDIIFNVETISKENLLNLLEKFIIDSDNLKISEKVEQLMEHPTFTMIPDNYRCQAIGICNQLIIEKAIENSNKWEINITDFQSDLRFSLSKFTKDYITFPSTNIESVPDQEYHKFIFIKKLTNISLKDIEKHQAYNDYMRSEMSYNKMLVINPQVLSDLEIYEEGVEDEIRLEKRREAYNLKEECFKTKEHLSKSRKVYFNCLQRTHQQINGVKDVQKYYRDGRIHSIVETTDFEWQFKKTDLCE